MPTKTSGPRMSDEAVTVKTGKNWKQWFAIIDKAGGQKMSHQEIVKLLNSKHNVGAWWGQMVTATYEQQTGLRQNHEKTDGFEISVLNVCLPPRPAQSAEVVQYEVNVPVGAGDNRG